MSKVKMIESLISCQTGNHQGQEAFVYVLDDDFNPQQRLLCQSCFNDQRNPLLTINPQQTQSRIQELQELVYDQVEAIVQSITGSKTSLNSFKRKVDQCFDNLFQEYQYDLLRIQRDNSEYSFHMEIQNIQSCLFQSENFDQVLEKYYIKKITKEVEKIQVCQSNYICLFDEQLNQERTIDELQLTNQFTKVDQFNTVNLLLSDEVISSLQDKEKFEDKLSDIYPFKYNEKKVKTIQNDFNMKNWKSIMISESFSKVNVKNEKTKIQEISLIGNFNTIQQVTNNNKINIANLQSEEMKQLNNSSKIQKDKMNERIISKVIQKIEPYFSETEIRIIKKNLVFLNNKEIAYFSNAFQIFYLVWFENDEWSTWLKIEKYILIGSEILIRAEFIKIYVNIKRKYQQSQNSNNICDQL